MSNLTDRTRYDADRLAKREAIAARLRAEKAEKAAARAAAIERREREWIEESFRRACARERRLALGGIPCHHGGYHDTCHTCKAESQRERDAEAQANL